MIVGSVTSAGEPVVPVTIHGQARRVRIAAILDTGFTGELCLARRHRRTMKLERLGEAEAELADGSRITQAVYAGRVTFDGELRRVLVTLTNSEDSLLGTAMLRRKRLAIDFRSGRVTVR